MNIRNYYPLTLIALLYACAGEQKNETPKTGQEFTTLEWSQKDTPKGFREEGNWCFNHFTEAVMITAPRQNTNQRQFDIGEGVYKVVINKGKPTASFFLQNTQNGPVQLYSGAHFPQCLSNVANFEISPNGFSYNNDQTIGFSVECLPNGPLFRILVDFPLASGYGMAVHKCTDCL